MATVTTSVQPPTPPSIPSAIPGDWTLADMLERLGDIPPNRIRVNPPLGMATEKDVLELKLRFGRICELVDGVLVEKTMEYDESMVAAAVVREIGEFVRKHDLGIVLGADGTLKVLASQVRIPDCCFISWQRFPNRQLPSEPIPRSPPTWPWSAFRGKHEGGNGAKASGLLYGGRAAGLVH